MALGERALKLDKVLSDGCSFLGLCFGLRIHLLQQATLKVQINLLFFINPTSDKGLIFIGIYSNSGDGR